MRLVKSGFAVGFVVVMVMIVIAACGGGDDKSKTPSGARASCKADAECVLTNQGGCCAACPEKPYALPTLNFEQKKNACAAASCVPPSDRIECPKVDTLDGYIAKCTDGTCAAAHR